MGVEVYTREVCSHDHLVKHRGMTANKRIGDAEHAEFFAVLYSTGTAGDVDIVGLSLLQLDFYQAQMELYFRISTRKTKRASTAHHCALVAKKMSLSMDTT
eukprot:IDg3200t1